VIKDLSSHDDDLTIDTDVVVVGGGTAGLVFAEILSRFHSVTVVESGPRQPFSEATDLDDAELTGSDYRAPREGRVRGLGGTSSKWGGALLPFLPADFDATADGGGGAWPVRFDELEEHFSSVEKLFRLVSGPYEKAMEGWLSPQGADPAFIARYAKWPTFSRRNVATLLNRQIVDSPTLNVWLNATCVGCSFDSGGAIRSLVARSCSGRQLVARARWFVLAAGPIESTRLLEWWLAAPGAPAASAALGLHLHDHVSARLAEIETAKPSALNRIAGFQFEKGTMRSFRLELSSAARRRLNVPGAFAHVAFSTTGPTSFDALRDMMRSVQRGKLNFASTGRLVKGAPYLVKLGWWRAFERRLYWPTPARYDLHVVTEQRDYSGNTIKLASRRDAYGVPLPSIHWHLGDTDIQTFRTVAEELDRFWAGGDLARVGTLRWLTPTSQIDRGSLDQAGDVFHPGGTTRMGESPADSVVDRNLSVWVVKNLSVLSTSTFPSGASANPTMTLLAFAHRLAGHVGKILGSPVSITTGQP
jgi:choline dehydrogenase-like flavoprotein